MRSKVEKPHTVEGLTSDRDDVKFVPPPIRKKEYNPYGPDPHPKHNKGVHTMDRERERRIFHKDKAEYQITGITTKYSQWGNPQPIVSLGVVSLLTFHRSPNRAI